jgi:hypothetical protein
MAQKVVTNDESVALSKHFSRLFSLLLIGINVTNLSGSFVIIPISTHPKQHLLTFYKISCGIAIANTATAWSSRSCGTLTFQFFNFAAYWFTNAHDL